MVDSLTAGWKVELSIGDGAAIGDVGLYDSSVYATEQLSGRWTRSTGAVAPGTFTMFTTAGLVTSIRVADVDFDGVDRRAEILAATYPTLLVIGGIEFTAISVAPNVGGPVMVVSPNSDRPALGELHTLTWLDSFSRYGTAGEADYLLDVSDRVRSLTTNTGRERFNTNFKTGSAQIVLDNNDGAFTPPAGQPIGVLPLRPGRVVVITNSGADVFYGYIDTFVDVQSGDGDVVTRLTAFDRLGQFARDNLPALATPEGAGELSDARVRRLLDRHLTDYNLTVFGEAANTMQSTVDAQPLGTELQLVAVSEGGAVAMLRTGIIGFFTRDWFSDRTQEPTTWTVGGVSPIKITDIESEWTAQRIVTEVHYARIDGIEQVEADAPAIDQYGRRTHTRLDLVNDNDADVQYLAARLLAFAKEDRQRVTALTFLPIPDTDTAEMGLQAVFGDTMLVTVNTIWGWSYTVPTQIFGVSHSVTDEVWTVTYTVDDSLFTGTLAAFDVLAFDAGFS